MSAEPQDLIQPARRPLLVGEANPYGGDPRYALYPLPERSAGGRLCRMILGLEARDYLRRYERRNLCAGRWSLREARTAALGIVHEAQGRILVLLGSKVANAFALAFEPWTIHQQRVLRPGLSAVDYQAVLLPHPSGLCRLWNEPGAVERARAAMREAGAL